MMTEAARAQDSVIEVALATELEQYKGQWVAVYDDHVVAAADDAVEVQQQALKNGVTDPLLFRVPTHSDRIAFF